MSLSNKLSIQDVDVKGKRVLIRVSCFFVPLEDIIPSHKSFGGKKGTAQVLLPESGVLDRSRLPSASSLGQSLGPLHTLLSTAIRCRHGSVSLFESLG